MVRDWVGRVSTRGGEECHHLFGSGINSERVQMAGTGGNKAGTREGRLQEMRRRAGRKGRWRVHTEVWSKNGAKWTVDSICTIPLLCPH